MYVEALFCGAYTFRIAKSSWWIDPLFFACEVYFV